MAYTIKVNGTPQSVDVAASLPTRVNTRTASNLSISLFAIFGL
jgi:hypothetical protein